MNSFGTIEINGTPPELDGKVCEGFICEGYIYDGETVASANVTYLKFEGCWFRLYFEHRMVFWRPFNEEPKPWEVTEKSWIYPHRDVGALVQVVGQRLLSCETIPTQQGCKVIFRFENQRRIEIEESDDIASYAII